MRSTIVQLLSVLSAFEAGRCYSEEDLCPATLAKPGVCQPLPSGSSFMNLEQSTEMRTGTSCFIMLNLGELCKQSSS